MSADPLPALDATAAAPLYRQLKERIQARIAGGDWAPGDPVPSEHDLMASLGVSRMTVNRALRELAADGWLERRRGVGTFVARSKLSSVLFEARDIRDEITERGHAHVSEVVTLGAVAAHGELAAALDMAPGATVFRSVLVHRENGVPIQLEERHVNPRFAPHYLEQDFRTVTPYEYLEGIGPMDAAEHSVEAVMPDAAVRRLLQVGAREPCLLLTRRTWCGPMVVNRARLTHPGSRYRFTGCQDYTPKKELRP
jgi:GntR family histidine utilization transcriptional repressor